MSVGLDLKVGVLTPAKEVRDLFLKWLPEWGFQPCLLETSRDLHSWNESQEGLAVFVDRRYLRNGTRIPVEDSATLVVMGNRRSLRSIPEWESLEWLPTPPSPLRVRTVLNEALERRRWHLTEKQMTNVLRHQDVKLRALMELAQKTATLEWLEIAKRILQHAQSIFDAEEGALLLFDEESSDMCTKLSFERRTRKFQNVRLGWKRSGLGKLILTGTEPVVVDDYEKDPRFPRPANEGVLHCSIQSAIGVGLQAGGRILGSLWVGDPAPHTRTQENLRFFAALAHHTAFAIEKSHAFQVLRESEERFRQIAENIGEVFWMTDPKRNQVIYISPAYEQIWGRTCQSLYETPNSFADSILPEDRERVTSAFAKQVQGDYDEVYRILRPDGSTRWIRDRAFPIRDESGAIYRIAGIAEDITEAKRAEDEIIRQRDALMQSEKLGAMGSLLAGVAHELNNPLTVVMGQTGFLRQMVGEGPLGARAEKIAQAAERCARIVRNFLALARQHPPERHEVRLNQVVHEAVELLAYPLRVDNVEVTLNLANDLPILWADPHQLHQVTVNLVSNAHQAMRGSPPPRRLTLTTRFDPAQARVFLDVADTGPGIPAAIRSRIFEPFFTTKPPGQGTGLGLSLCQGIIEGHGGTIRAESPPPRGAIFRIELPMEAPPVAKSEGPTAEALPLIRGKKILVVDDEPDIAAVLADLLSADGHQVETATNGAIALDKLQEQAYDLILSDLRMPELDGPGFYREVERHHRQLLRRFIFLTGDTLGPETARFLEQAGAPSLNKPFALEEVRQVVQRVLQAP